MKHIYTSLVFLLLLSGCSKEDEKEVTRTIIAYFAADNDLWADALRSIEEMKAGFKEGGARLIVFADITGEAPCIMEIGVNSATTVKIYPECNSADATQMRKILEDITALYPADSYGLILWSHGSSWLPASSELRAFGYDSGVQINIPELAAALPVKFDYILFDACLMGSVEVAYELRHKTNFIVAPSTPTLYTGFPYEDILPELLSFNPNLRKVAGKYFDYYQEIMTGIFQSATISVIDTREMEKLAAATRRIIESQSFDKVTFNRTSVQRLDTYEEQYLFDFIDFINKAFPEANKNELLGQLNKTVLCKAHTAKFMNQFEIATFCGLSCYVPLENRSDLSAYYQQLEWCKAVGFNKLL